MKMLQTDFLTVNLTNLKNSNETTVKPDLIINLNNKSSAEMKELLANFTTRNILSVMNQIQKDKFSDVFLFQNINDCKGAIINSIYFKLN